MSTYDRRGFAAAYADAQNTHVPGADGEREGYPEALHEYRIALLSGLERLFGLRLDYESVPEGMRPVLDVLDSTVRSYLAISGPMDNYLEAGLTFIRLQQAGVLEQFVAQLHRIDECNTESRTAHLDSLETLIGVLLGDNANRVVSEDELRAIGVETVPPNPDDYEW